jgi:VanZ family protein
MFDPAPAPRSILPQQLLVAAFWTALAVSLTMALLPHPPHTPIDRFGDKFEHMLAFAVLSGLGSAAYPQLKLRVLALALSAVGALIEVLQAIPWLHRDSDIRDWIADTAATAVVLVAVKLWQWLVASRASSSSRAGDDRT